ncbi:MAG: AI-2E family transporter [Oscillospiraceae bacterium]|nr:AI-2E family transporter [Oscillospiraceae bacterium]
MLNWIRKYSKWVTLFILGAALIAVYKTFNSFAELKGIISVVMKAIKPFILAFVIAYVINIPAKHLNNLVQKKAKTGFLQKHSWAMSVAFVYVMMVIILVIVFCSVVPMLYKNCMDMIKNMPGIIEQIIEYINNLDVIKRLGINININDLQSAINKWVQSMNSSMVGKYASGALSITSSIMSFASGVMNTFIGVIASIYMIMDKDRIIRSIKRNAKIFSRNSRFEKVLGHLASVNQIFTQYIYSRLICCVIMAVACSIVLALMGEQYALILGLFIGVMDMIPYFGSIISWAVGFVLMTVSGGLFHSIWCSIAMFVMQQIDGNVLAPRVMGSRLEVRPLAIIIAVTVGGSLFGFIGMLVSVPVVAIIRAIFTEYVQSREKAARHANEDQAEADIGNPEEAEENK